MNLEQQLQRIHAAMLSASVKQTAPLSDQAPIAIIGLSGYFPNAMSVKEFWTLLDKDQQALASIPLSRFDWQQSFSPDDVPGKNRSRWGGFIPDIAGFDPLFFHITPAEAAELDPKLRLLLMSAYLTLGDAGLAPSRLRESATGVFIAAQDNDYSTQGYAQACLLANRLSYFFDWRGTSEIIDAQCPGAALALHRAVQALRSGELTMALVGAANVILSPEPYLLLSEHKQLSRQPHVASFGRDADGHLRSEGVATVLLKPLANALADGDPIYAAIKNSWVNFNGQGGASIAAPNVASHVELIVKCYEQTGVDIRRIAYIEAQGMGNRLADLAEWQAFNQALTQLAQRQKVRLSPGQCRVSTLKPLLGHMESASVLGALFKIIRSFKTNTIHKIIGFTEANPDLELVDVPCRLVKQTEAWPEQDLPRLAGLHAYAMGGSNAHLLIEDYVAPITKHFANPHSLNQPQTVLPSELIVLSAASQASLLGLVRALADYLTGLENPPELADVAHTLQIGRDDFTHRLALIVSSISELSTALPLLSAEQPVPAQVFFAQGQVDAKALTEVKPLSIQSSDAASLKTFSSALAARRFSRLV
ncbi:beta-ketoacyl synthase N-terminal-like domain-containing protein [Methylocucumis oryzae]|uniref:beta-ketoacyl synthase N-terminal-like domain-containing protein n=1 Tax=Methylocucumis oryzae TaxID=1632867 RepID=UPI0006973976|nr:polyketide synthase [Methylocucumis oryzae]